MMRLALLFFPAILYAAPVVHYVGDYNGTLKPNEKAIPNDAWLDAVMQLDASDEKSCAVYNGKRRQWWIATYRLERQLNALGLGTRWRFGSQIYWVDAANKKLLKKYVLRPPTDQGQGDRNTSKVLACTYLPQSALLVAVTGGRLYVVDVARSIVVLNEERDDLPEEHAFVALLSDKNAERFVIKTTTAQRLYSVKK